MAADPIQIGPFVGGLNTFSDPTAVADNEAVQIENFELDLDGSLVSRPPIVDKSVSMPLGVTGDVSYLGYYYAPGNVPYLIGSDGLSSTYYFNGTTWILITNTIAATAMAQFDAKAWLVAPVGSANPGGYWTPGGGFVTDANMPKGDSIVAHKFRLWVSLGRDATVNGTRLYFSKTLGTIPLWPVAPDFIDVGAGDGQNIVQLQVYYQTLLIFRSDSIYSFSYTADPAAGTASLMVNGVGLADKFAIAPFEGYIYFLYDDKAYEFINNRAAQINIKVPFVALNRSGIYRPYSVSIYNNRVIYSFYDVMFVFSLKTRTWTRWVSTQWGAIGLFMVQPTSTIYVSAIVHSSKSVPAGPSRSARTLFSTDGVTTDAEPMHCVLQTKNYNYDSAGAYKKLDYWGVDASYRGVVEAVVTPISYNYQVTWGQLLTTTWGTLKNFTWGQPMSGTLSVETVRDTTGTGAMRKFTKFLKRLRFRQVTFKLDFTTDGSISTAPVRVFSLITYVRAKERVAKTIT